MGEKELETDSLQEKEDEEDKIDSKVPQFIDSVVDTRADAEPSLKKNNVELVIDVKEKESDKEDKKVTENMQIHESIGDKSKDNNTPSHQENKNSNTQKERVSESLVVTDATEIEESLEGSNSKNDTSVEGKVDTVSAEETKNSNIENKTKEVLALNEDKTNKSINETDINEQQKEDQSEIIEDVDIVKMSDEELLHIDNLKSITEKLKGKIGANNQTKNNYIFETRTFETVEEIQETVAIHLKDAKAAISRKQIIVIQQTI